MATTATRFVYSVHRKPVRSGKISDQRRADLSVWAPAVVHNGAVWFVVRSGVEYVDPGHGHVATFTSLAEARSVMRRVGSTDGSAPTEEVAR